MLPCLHLLDSSREDSSSNKDVEALRDTLKRLLIEHVISPYRTQCLDRRGRDQSTGELSNPLREDLVSSLKQYHFPGPEEGDLSKRTPYEAERSASKTEKHRIITFLSLLFKVALGSHPRNTPNQRRAEDGWLEELFAQLTECAAILIPHVSPTHAQRDYSRLVKWMMQHALDHNLRLSLSALKSILDQASGLFSDEGDHEDDNVDWNIISLCLLVDADVFTISDSSATRESPYGYRTPNKYLSTLFLKLTDDYLHKSSRTDQDYNFKLSHVVLPLISAYSDARDLTGFIEHWREQLDTLQKGQSIRQDPERDNSNVWEDDKLVQHVAQLADSTLTVGQMERLLKEAVSGLITSSPHATNDTSIPRAKHVIIDSMCAGVIQEEKLSKLSDTAQSVFSLVSELLMKPSNRDSIPRWRIWRILATIRDRWTSLDVSSIFKERTQSMMLNAFELIKQIPEWGSADRAIELKEELHAFGYVLSFARLDHFFWDNSKPSSRQIIKSAIGKLVTVMQPFCDRVSHDFFETVKLESARPRADTPNSLNNNVEYLYVQSMTYTTCCPELFR